MRRSAPGLFVEPAFSRSLLLLLAAFHGLALLAAAIPPWPIAVKVGGSIALFVSALVCIDRQVRRPAVKSLRLQPDGSWRLSLRDGRECDGELSGESVITPIFTVMAMKTSCGRGQVLIFRDSLDEQSYRKLRVALVVYGGVPTARVRSDKEG